MAIVFAVCTYLPQHKVYIFLLGPVKLVYLALFTALIDIMSISSGNAGGHIAHLGGALFGWFFIVGVRRNRDFASGIVNFFEGIGRLFQRKKKMRVRYKKHVSEMNDPGNTMPIRRTSKNGSTRFWIKSRVRVTKA